MRSAARGFGLSLALMVLSACATSGPDERVATRPDEPLDPQALVGEWRGEYVNHFNPSFSDVLVVTITRVEGDRVFGTSDQWVPGKGGHATRRRTRPVRGTLHGHTLKTDNFEATVDGQRMTGHFKDEEFELIKQTAGGPQQTDEVPAAPRAARSMDGVYAGDVCLGPSPNGDPARCFKARGTVGEGRIVGEWPGREGVTVRLAGEVATTGDVSIEWHSERPDGSQFSRANLSGTIQEGHLDANGAFSSGRTVSIRWTLNAPGNDSSEKESDGREHPSQMKRK